MMISALTIVFIRPHFVSITGLDGPTRSSPSSRTSPLYLFSVLGGTLSGFTFNGPPTQGSSFLATLGWRTQSLWDWEGAKHMALDTYSPLGRNRTMCRALKGPAFTALSSTGNGPPSP